MRRVSVRVRRRLGAALIVVGIGCGIFAPVALVNGERVGFLLLFGGALLAYVGWIALPPRGRPQVNWRQIDMYGITLRENLVVYALQTIAFVVVGFVLGWFWSAVISIAAFFLWFVLRMRERR